MLTLIIKHSLGYNGHVIRNSYETLVLVTHRGLRNCNYSKLVMFIGIQNFKIINKQL